jgi:large subunit ribosomal protein L35
MPKMKTHSGAKKRFRLTANGKVRGRHAFSTHILEKKSPKRKRRFSRPVEISAHDTPRVKELLGVKKGRQSRPGDERLDVARRSRNAGPGAPRRTS